MTAEDIKTMVGEEVEKAMKPIADQVNTIAKSFEGNVEPEPTPQSGELNEEDIAKMVGAEVAKAIKPITDTLAPLMKSRALPGNLNNEGDDDPIEKGEQHYLHGVL